MTNITSKKHRKYKEKPKFVTIIFNNKMEAIVDSLAVKIKKLISLYGKAKQKVGVVVNENEKLKEELAKKQETVEKLEEKIKVIKISKLVSIDKEDNKKTKQKINEYVREIDKCIGLLNK
ncbi:MAG: hypothetical protein H8E84_04000 [Flavobacteriales bacterium]|nr:hypothetical protein [Flavobacteriales bacterium]